MTPDVFYIVLLAVAVLFRILQPKSMNYFYGYRTPRSRKSPLHWKVANRYSANMLLVLSVILITAHFGLKYFGLAYDNALVCAMLGGFAFVFYFTEKKLKTLDNNEV